MAQSIKRIIALPAIAVAVVLAMASTAFAATTYTEGTLNYTVDNGSITITNCYGNDSEVTVPDQIAGNPVNTIAAGAFSGNTKVSKINLPDTVTTVESGAFRSGQTAVFYSNTAEPVEREVTGDTEYDPASGIDTEGVNNGTEAVIVDLGAAEGKDSGELSTGSSSATSSSSTVNLDSSGTSVSNNSLGFLVGACAVAVVLIGVLAILIRKKRSQA